MSWAGATWRSGFLTVDGRRIQKGIPWVWEDDLASLLEDVCPDGWIEQ